MFRNGANYMTRVYKHSQQTEYVGPEVQSDYRRTGIRGQFERIAVVTFKVLLNPIVLSRYRRTLAGEQKRSESTIAYQSTFLAKSTRWKSI